jgi:DNA-binding FadR family transcriptional regulator
MTPGEERVALLALVDAIVGGALASGDRLRAPDLARTFGTSLLAIRGALQGLSRRKLVRLASPWGAVVRPREDWDILDADVLAALLPSSSPRPVPCACLDVRIVAERSAAQLAARNASEEDLEGIARALRRMEVAAGLAFGDDAWEEEYQRADVEFHRAVARASRNRVLVRKMEPILESLAVTLPLHARPAARFERALPEHERILSAIAGGDPERASAAMGEHLETVGRYLAELA